MSLIGRAVGPVLGMPPARTRKVRVRRGVPIPMDDGVTLFADHFAPVDDPCAPLVLVRTPYDRASNGFYLRLLAERGYQALIVNLRGTAGSGGRFSAFRLEPGDGPSVVRWLRGQPWFPGAFATWGASFLGYSQWELATEPIPEWKAAFILDAPSEVYDTFMYRGGVFTLEDWLGWTQGMATADLPSSMLGALLSMRKERRRRRHAVDALPVTDADRLATGRTVDFFQRWLHTPGPWPETDFRGHVDAMPPVVYQVGGWQDLFLPGTMADHRALVRSGRQVRLRVGPWTHGRGLFDKQTSRDLFTVLDHSLRGIGELPSAPVRLFVTGDENGEGTWREFDRWPPAAYRSRAWYLSGDGGLSTSPPRPEESPEPSCYRYDPRRPTPSVGGPLLRNAGVRDNRQPERRDDVLVFTGPVLSDALEIIGEPEAEIRLRSSRVHTDVFVRLCDVHPNGRSANVCDGIVRLGEHDPMTADGVRGARVLLWPTAHVFDAGHRVRLQVSSGAHPRYLRNLGTGDQLGTETLAVDQEVLHDRDHPSAIRLPERVR